MTPSNRRAAAALLLALIGSKARAVEPLSGRYYRDSSGEGVRTSIPGVALADGETQYRIFDATTSYREDRMAAFELAEDVLAGVQSARIHVKAFNDDRQFYRGVRFEIDGKGVYLGAQARRWVDPAKKKLRLVTRDSFRSIREDPASDRPEAGAVPADNGITVDPGALVLMPGATSQWTYDLGRVRADFTEANEKDPSRAITFLDILKRPGPHKISCWVSTYAQYGPGSKVTLDLFVRPGARKPSRPLPEAGGPPAVPASGGETPVLLRPATDGD